MVEGQHSQKVILLNPLAGLLISQKIQILVLIIPLALSVNFQDSLRLYRGLESPSISLVRKVSGDYVGAIHGYGSGGILDIGNGAYIASPLDKPVARIWSRH